MRVRRWFPNRRWGLVMAGSVVVAVTLAILMGNYLLPDCEREGCPAADRLETYRPPEPPKILDASGELAGQLSGPRRIVVEADSIPEIIEQGYVAVEDHRFYEHGGIDLKGGIRAFFANVGKGGVEQGASTITMQLARNVFGEEVLSYNRWHRKATEIRLAREIEAQLSKDRILNLYLNQIYLGDGVWGVETASRHYFGKSVGELNLTEAALIIGLAKNPEGYNPRRNPERARARIALVLDILRGQAIITAEEAAEARDRELDLEHDASTRDWGANAYYLSAVRRELRDIFPNPADRRGLRVHTGLDQGAQAAARESLVKQLRAIESGQWGTFRHETPGDPMAPVEGGRSPYLQGLVVAMDPRSGVVTTLVGGRDYDHTEFDRAFQAQRQPGSAFKPIVYAAALSQGLRLSDDVSTEPVRYASRGSEDWQPRDHVSGESLTVRDALVFSSNTAAVRVGQRVGTGRVARQAAAMGISGEIPDYPSIYLGAAEVVPVELVAAFASFGNGGRRIEPHLITRIESGDGREIWRRQNTGAGQAIDPRLGFLVLDMMRDVVNRGTGWRVGRALSIPAAGKTGTTNDSKDLWFVGLTPGLAAGVWIGFDSPRTVVAGAGGGDLAAPVWAEFVGAASGGAGSAEPWSPPPGVTQFKVDSETGRRWNEFCRGTMREEYFLSGTEPMAECRPSDPYWYQRASGDWMYDSTAAGVRWPDRSDSAAVYARDPDSYRTRFYDDSMERREDREGGRRDRDDWEDRLREDRERRLDSLETARDRDDRRDSVQRHLDAMRRNEDRIRPADTTLQRTPPGDTIRIRPRPDTVPRPPAGGEGEPPADTTVPDTTGAGGPADTPPADTSGSPGGGAS